MSRGPEKERSIEPTKQGDGFTGLLPPPPVTEKRDTQPNDTHILLRSLSQRIDDLSIAFMRVIDAFSGHLSLRDALPEHTASEPVHLQRRRTQDEMLHALRLLASGEPRPRDDESVQTLEDAIHETIALRQITMDLMQASTTSYQTGLAAIRKMTEQ